MDLSRPRTKTMSFSFVVMPNTFAASVDLVRASLDWAGSLLAVALITKEATRYSTAYLADCGSPVVLTCYPPPLFCFFYCLWIVADGTHPQSLDAFSSREPDSTSFENAILPSVQRSPLGFLLQLDDRRS